VDVADVVAGVRHGDGDRRNGPRDPGALMIERRRPRRIPYQFEFAKTVPLRAGRHAAGPGRAVQLLRLAVTMLLLLGVVVAVI
jgi:hypothetical protein